MRLSLPLPLPLLLFVASLLLLSSSSSSSFLVWLGAATTAQETETSENNNNNNNNNGVMQFIPEVVLAVIPDTCQVGDESEFPQAMQCALENLLQCSGLVGVWGQFATMIPTDMALVNNCDDFEASYCPIVSQCTVCEKSFDSLARCIVTFTPVGIIDQSIIDLVDTCALVCDDNGAEDIGFSAPTSKSSGGISAVASPIGTVTEDVTTTDDDLVDIPTTALTAGIFDTLVAALTATDLVSTLSEPNGPWTVFAPTDEAFAALPEGFIPCLLQEENVLVLYDMLLHHVVVASDGQAALLLSTDFTNGMTLPTLLSENELSQHNVIMDVVSSIDDGVIVKINNSTVITPDILASNGVIHSIDQVLVPSNVDVAAFIADTCNNNNGGSGSGSGSGNPTATTFTFLAAVDKDVTNEDIATAIEKTIRAVLSFSLFLSDSLSEKKKQEKKEKQLGFSRRRHRFLAPRNDDSSGLEVTTVVTTERNCNNLLQEAKAGIDTTNQRCVSCVTTLTATSPPLGANNVTVDVTAAQQQVQGAIQDGSFHEQLQEVAGLTTTVLFVPLSAEDEDGAVTVAVADADADADADEVDTVCKSIHNVLADVGATEFSRLLQQREIDFKYGVFTVFAPPDNLILEAAENVNTTNLDDILYFHVAANVVEETLTDYCGTSLVMLNDMLLDSQRTQENSTTVCASEQVYQLGPGNRAPNIPPRVVGTANEACNGVVYKILHSLMLPTPMEGTRVIIAPAPSPSTNPGRQPTTQIPTGEGSGGNGGGGGGGSGVGPGGDSSDDSSDDDDGGGDSGDGVGATPTQMMRPTLSPTTAAFIDTPTQMISPTTNGTNQVDDTPTGTSAASAAPAFQLPSPPPAPTAPGRQPTTNPPPVPPTGGSDPSSDDPPNLQVPPFTLDDGGGEEESDSDSGSNYLFSCWNQLFVIAVSTTFLLHSFF